MKGKNVIVIMSDEHDPRYMGVSGHPFIKTPNLDAMARRGVRFPNAYTPSPICVPARAAFATGKRVHDTRHWDNASPYTGMPRGWGHVLQDQGVRVESIGKLHYRTEQDPNGFDREHLPMHVQGGHGMVWGSIRDPYYNKGVDTYRVLGEHIGAGNSTYTRYDESITARAVQWFQDPINAQSPFVLYIGLVAPHFPLVVPQEFFDLYPRSMIPAVKLHPDTGYQRHPWVEEYADFGNDEKKFDSLDQRLDAFAAYFGLCSFLDHNIGQILNALKDSGLDEETYVIYTSDHGDNLGARGLWGKSTMYQESVCVPMIMTGPGLAASVCETPVDLLDLYPTILQASGMFKHADMEGRPGQSLLDLAAQPADTERAILSEYHAFGSNTAAFMLRKGPWKLIYYVRYRPELFNLDQDPEELMDLAQDPAYQDVLAAMQASLRTICDPEQLDREAKQDQHAMLARFGGVDGAIGVGPKSETPAPASTT